MTSLLIKNAHVVTLDDENRVIADGSVYVEDSRIVDVGNLDAEALDPDRTIDAEGKLLMPGLIIAHHHLYSTFARGFTPPGPPATNFDENLRFLWWKLDAALDTDDVYYSAVLALMDAALAGCTTVIDHHASPSVCDGSLDWVERAFTDVGLSGCLCYEVSDRNKPGEGIEENERFIRKCRDSDSDQVAAMFGLHASMTLSDETLDRCAAIGKELDAGFHVHAAEDAIDVKTTRERHGKRVLDRFHERGMTGRKSIFVHGTHLEPAEMALLADTDSMLVSNPESNMNNGLPVSPVLDFLRHGVLVGIGTDGMSSHVISQARAMYMHQRTLHRDPTIAFGESCDILLRNNRRIANRLFNEPRGAIAKGQLADLIIHNYVPFTPLRPDTLFGHLLFGIGFSRAHTTIARGNVIVENGVLTKLVESEVRADCVERASAIWARIR
ncbi:MAG: putative aminohydrolase SsnA [Woeseiaceae bacterium]|nr:putative aminohydrolase SsnA [Woeseiaceae bacterium]